MTDSDRTKTARRQRLRSHLLVGAFMLVAAALVVRAVDLQVLDDGFLSGQADARHLRVEKISAHRGAVTDRNGEPLAVSSPVDSVWADPELLAPAAERLPMLAADLEREPEWLLRRVTSNADREFVYLRRHLSPENAGRVAALRLPGVHILREYRRYYPAGEVTGHLLGFTNIDDVGLEGLELAYDHWLAGAPGAKRVLRDRLGQSVEDVERLSAPRDGRTLVTSIDLRLQYLAYRALKAAVQQHSAKSGSVVMLDIATGEVLAMVNQPSYNPNDRSQLVAVRYRNRSVTDIFEPGSSIKPLVLAAALEGGTYTPDTIVDTNPGQVTVGPKVIKDTHNYGIIDVTGILTRSSNVGATKIVLSLEPKALWTVLDRVGLGHLTSSGFPGESAGLLVHHSRWRPIAQATLAYGYGLSVTPLQLAQAYAVIGAGGLRRSVTLLRQDEPMPAERVLSARTARQMIGMLETVVSPEGTGGRAAVPGYRVAGKTGTARKFEAGGYSEERYISVFAGLAPASRPRLALVVMIDEPSGLAYYGGEVAAPVFAEIMAGALRLLAIAPDAVPARLPGAIVQARADRDAAAGDRQP